MQLVNMDGYHQESHQHIRLGPFSPRLNAICGPRGSGKTAIIAWLRYIAFEDGARERLRVDLDRNGQARNGSMLGGMEIQTSAGRFRCGNDRNGRVYSELLQPATRLNGAPGTTDGLSGYDGYASHDSYPHGPALTARQRLAFLALSELSGASDTEAALADVIRRLQLDCKIHQLRSELSSTISKRGWLNVGENHHSQLKQLDERLDRWLQTLHDLKLHRERIEAGAADARLDQQVGDRQSHAASADGHAGLRKLEAQIVATRMQLDELVARYGGNAIQEHNTNNREYSGREYIVARDQNGQTRLTTGRTEVTQPNHLYHSSLPEALGSMQRELLQVCQQLSRREATAAAETLRQQTQQLHRCETELLQSVEKLIDERDVLLHSIAAENRLPIEQVQLAFGNWRQCHAPSPQLRSEIDRHVLGLMGPNASRGQHESNVKHEYEGFRWYDPVDGVVVEQADPAAGVIVPDDVVRLGMRLAIVEALAARGEPICLVLDETLDDVPSLIQRSAIAYLASNSKPSQQIIVLTSREDVARMVREHGGFIDYLRAKPPVSAIRDINRELSAYANELDADAWHFPPRLPSRRAQEDRRTGRSEFYLNDQSLVEELPAMDPVSAARCRALGIDRIADLLDVDARWLARKMRIDGVSSASVADWQAESRLLCAVRRLRPFDARVLVGAGIRDPQQLSEVHPGRLLDSVEDFLATGQGRDILRSGSSYELSRITAWIAAAKNGSTRYHRTSMTEAHGSNHVREERKSREVRDLDSSQRHVRLRRATRRPRRANSSVEPTLGSAPRRRRTTATTELRGRSHNAKAKLRDAHPQVSQAVRMAPPNDAETPIRLRFFLELSSPVVDAPSIGPKMAARLEKNGVHTIDQLLAANPVSLSDKLNLMRIRPQTIERWQAQARLMCRIPNLRGHDAQLLASCELTSPEALSRMNPEQVLAQVLAVARTPDGQRILRGGKEPDLPEVAQWIAWAANCRSLSAA